MKVQQYKDILLECLVTLRHARTFVTSREKMHPTGVELYDKLVTDIEGALTAPGPEGPTQETRVGSRDPWKVGFLAAAAILDQEDGRGPECVRKFADEYRKHVGDQ